MKRIIILLLVFSVLAWPMVSGAEDFRSAVWGAKPEQVEHDERMLSLYHKSDNQLVFHGKVVGFPAAVYFHFSSSGLDHGTILFLQKHVEAERYMEDHAAVRKLLIEKYGNPSSNAETWSGTNAKTKTKQLAEALAKGQVNIVTGWKTDTSEIFLILGGKDGRISMRINYFSKDLYNFDVKREARPNEL
ncbi:MAG: hypothetical protein P9L99_16055 [Candidatus Lernaella stagnicola]|nr:hypothetical protein [Candidatus Lernaella stagnicola]